MLPTLLGLGLAITSSVVEQRVREGRWNKPHENNKFRQLIVDGRINPRKESKEDIERVLGHCTGLRRHIVTLLQTIVELLKFGYFTLEQVSVFIILIILFCRDSF